MDSMQKDESIFDAGAFTVALVGWGRKVASFEKQLGEGSCVDLGGARDLDLARLAESRADLVLVHGCSLEGGSPNLLDRLAGAGVLGGATRLLDRLDDEGLLDSLPVIFYLPACDTAMIAEVIRKGAYDVLARDMGIPALCVSLRSFHMSWERVKRLQAQIANRASAVGTIRSGEFEIRTLIEARNLSTMLSLACPNPKAVAPGLFEILLNAVEHGILRIGYDDKTELLQSGRYADELERRLAAPEYRDGYVTVHFERRPDELVFRIVDTGPGFDPAPYLEFSPERAADPHGRGIALSRLTSFDSLEYLGRGNEVLCKVATGGNDLPR